MDYLSGDASLLSDAGFARLCSTTFRVDADADRFPNVLGRGERISVFAHEGDRVVGAVVASMVAPTGYIDLLAVEPTHRRQGIARHLMRLAECHLASVGCHEVRFEGHSPHYLWPGIDVRCTSAICCVERLGYRGRLSEINMTVDLERAHLGLCG